MVWIKFVAGALFGMGMFLFPAGDGDGFSTPVGLLTEWLEKLITANVPWFLYLLVALSAIGALVSRFYMPDFIARRKWAAGLFYVSWPYLLTRLAALAVVICVGGEIGPEWIRGEDVGGSMVGLSQTLVALAFSLSFVLPFLTDTGIMEFTGVLLKPVIRPLFHVPGRASVDLIASWLASSNTAVLITAGQYNGGYYSRREAATIMTNFSLVSIPFCMVVAGTLHVEKLFPLLYLTVTAVGLLLAVIAVRIPPLSTVAEDYHGEPQLREEVPQGNSLLNWAVAAALERAEKFRLSAAVGTGLEMAVGILLDLIPIVIAWGTIGTLLVNETLVFQWIAYPMGLYMWVLGIPDAFVLAPATLVGFIDMFIPALITSPESSEQVRFFISALSLVQIIYLTEVGSIIVKSNVGLDMKRLFVIFLERTLVAIPLLWLVTKFFVG
ncbi:MAG: YjiH family protein [Selenomonas sp.]|uniref:YjiH family protein n=1 Tax=Selenomonas ruminantium TaxID=971 RepID=UPI001B17E5A5|nr:nucleoside recognition domain-containing protein [Selenomonas ruminantium]MBO5652311.1 YjiH family protein [Selenomonas sp.]MBO6202909.1 YjiH family protein [Selenomonas sp.]